MNHINAKLQVTPDVSAKLSITPDVKAALGVGTVAYASGTTDYEILRNKPSIEDVELVGNKTFDELGMNALSVQEIEKILYLD